jgi:hypothetical protein
MISRPFLNHSSGILLSSRSRPHQNLQELRRKTLAKFHKEPWRTFDADAPTQQCP